MACQCGHEQAEALVAPTDISPPRISDEAREQAVARLDLSGHDALRLVVDKQHHHELFADARRDGDLVLDLDGLSLLVDPKTAGRVAGLVIDYVRADGVEGFVLQDPAAKARVSTLPVDQLRRWVIGGKSVWIFDVRADRRPTRDVLYAEAQPLDHRGRSRLASLCCDVPLVFLAEHRERAWAAAGHAVGEGFVDVYACEHGLS